MFQISSNVSPVSESLLLFYCKWGSPAAGGPRICRLLTPTHLLLLLVGGGPRLAVLVEALAAAAGALSAKQ
jgi:hypothetical protein